VPEQGDLRLHLGCHIHVVPGWENIDKTPNVYLSRLPRFRRALVSVGVLSSGHDTFIMPPGVIRADVSKGLAYPDSSARYIYTSHMIEHMSRWQALGLIRECARVLTPGGILRVATPDLRKWVREYVEGDTSRAATPADSLMEKLGTFRDESANPIGRYIRRLFSGSVHQWLYDLDSLSYLLLEGGFSECVPRDYRQGDMPDLDRLEHRRDSVFVEAHRDAAADDA
jgi:predicted SAM-dependent methyltransferase